MKKGKFCFTVVIAVLMGEVAPLSAATLYWSDSALDVHRIDTDGTGQETLPVSGINFIGGLAIDPVGQKLYWSETGATDKIQRSDLDGSNIEDVVSAGLGDPRGLAIDQTEGRLFWVDIQINWVTQALLANFTATQQLFVSNGGTHVALDTLNGKIYWLKNQLVKGMATANMDGLGVVDDIITSGVMTSPDGLAIDPAAGKLYWTDIGGVWWSDLDGNNRVKIVALPASSVRGIALDIAGGKMYFGFQDKIMQANLDGTSSSDFLTGLASNPKHLVLDDSGSLMTSWTYQGELLSNGLLVNDTAVMRFTLWTSAGGGAQVGTANVLNNVELVDGRFTVLLDFAAGAFTGKRWLQIEVMGSGDADFVSLSPRQLITPSPLSLDTVNEHTHSSLDAADGDPTGVLFVDDDGQVNINASFFNNTALGVHGGLQVFDDLDEGIFLNSDRLILAEGASEDPVYDYRSATDTHRFYTLGAQRLTILANGNVGIGDTTPGARLEVAGGETILEQEAWQTPVFENGWVNYSGTYNDAGYFKDSVGVVHLRGLVKNGTIGQTIFTLPVGYRPAARGIFPSVSNSVPGRIDVLPDGRVIPLAGNSVWLSLEGITFRAEQ
jgi:DNA-binding beta-propeller fold protein YncE